MSYRGRGRSRGLGRDSPYTPGSSDYNMFDDAEQEEVTFKHAPATPKFRGNPAPARDPQRRIVPWRNRYDSTEMSVRTYISWFETHASLNDYSEKETCSQLLLSFGKATAQLVKQLPINYSYEDLCQTLHRYYEPDSQRRTQRTKLMAERRKKEQTPRQYAERLRELGLRANPCEGQEAVDDRVLDIFLRSQDKASTRALAIKDPQSLEEAINFLDTYEAATADDTPEPEVKTAADKSPDHARSPPVTAANTDCDSLEGEIDNLVDMTIAEVNACHPMVLPDGSVEDPVDFVECFDAKMAWRFPRRSLGLQKCLYCNGDSHDESSCYKLIRRLHQRGFDITRYRPRATMSYNRPYQPQAPFYQQPRPALPRFPPNTRTPWTPPPDIWSWRESLVKEKRGASEEHHRQEEENG